MPLQPFRSHPSRHHPIPSHENWCGQVSSHHPNGVDLDEKSLPALYRHQVSMFPLDQSDRCLHPHPIWLWGSTRHPTRLETDGLDGLEKPQSTKPCHPLLLPYDSQSPLLQSLQPLEYEYLQSDQWAAPSTLRHLFVQSRSLNQ